MTRMTGQFEVTPTKTRDGWERIVRGGGSSDDLESVFKFLAEAWQFDAGDPRGFQRWLLVEDGVESRQLSPPQLSDRKRLFALDQEARLAPTKEMVRALVNGIHAQTFFAAMGRFSGDLRVLAYEIAVTTYEGVGAVYALAALSLEAQWIIDAALKAFAERPLLSAYKAFTLPKGARACLGLRDDREPVQCEATITIDQLFCLATNPPSNIARQLEHLGKTAESRLLQIAGKLLSTLPDRGFGQFVKVNLSLFVCCSTSRDNLFESAKSILISTAEPNVAKFLRTLGEEYVRSELQRINRTFEPGHERFAAALIDAWRHICSDSSEKFEETTNSIKIKAPLVILAISAGTARKSVQGASRFQRLLTKELQNAKDPTAREWLIRNPEFIKYLTVGRASLQSVKAILDAARSTPSEARSVAAEVLEQLNETTPLEHGEEALRTLIAIGGKECDDIFTAFVSRRIKAENGLYIRDLFARDPGAALLRRNFQSVLEKVEEQHWEILFRLLLVRSPESTLLKLTENVFARGGALADWLVNSLLPALLEGQALSPSFFRWLTNIEMTTALAKSLATKVAADVEELRHFRTVWPQRRAENKNRLLARVMIGLQIAINATVPATRLHWQLSKLRDAAEELSASDFPMIDPVIATLASTDVPDPIPDEETLRGVFTHDVPTAMQFVLMAGNNSWVIDTVFRRRGPWPKAELLFGQIVDRFVYVSQIRQRSREQLETVANSVNTEVAIALRDLLSDIEAELAGYFALRDILDQHGLHPVSHKLGVTVSERDLSSERHKVLRDPKALGQLRIFSLGIEVNGRIVAGSLVMNSGSDDDRD